jgi:hypothetical protein
MQEWMQDVPLTPESFQQFMNDRDTLRQLAQASQYAAGGLTVNLKYAAGMLGKRHDFGCFIYRSFIIAQSPGSG